MAQNRVNVFEAVGEWCEQAQQHTDIPIAVEFDYGWEVYAQIALTLKFYHVWKAAQTTLSNVRRELHVYAGTDHRADIILSYQWGGTDIIEMKCESKRDREVTVQFGARLHDDIMKLRNGVIDGAYPNPRKLVFGITVTAAVTTETRNYFQAPNHQSLGVREESVPGTDISVFFWRDW